MMRIMRSLLTAVALTAHGLSSLCASRGADASGPALELHGAIRLT